MFTRQTASIVLTLFRIVGTNVTIVMFGQLSYSLLNVPLNKTKFIINSFSRYYQNILESYTHLMPPSSRMALVETFVWAPAPFQSPGTGLGSKVATICKESGDVLINIAKRM